ncbi:hybrid sensor histidine kinase/response regulator [Paracoccus sp. PS-1]|uniref:ATP-binding response regulator n=1 Tax=unclassified Paracoccus (in: a-proteobacteria) TaxID=2688777 RepID=UPI000491CA35|nr:MULTISPECIES: hybrid sensor histidine kinase/response regulator [unclassified Paracoccus (in: a-proteobacteria)]MDQ7262976.1 hybrid sensor histidine kinase/response regulator [Paracoccus sp. PS1]RQP06389.1 MAG: hybrid sensor histidine kinase/response regulator [Paracoccus sp. BP8]UFM66044.1 hybrid sensor histidine kinase/response regulator [Paracoccus sp. MA]
MFLRDDDPPARRVEKLTRIADVLVERIDRLEESRGSAWSMFQAAVALEQEVQVRTRELEQALADLSERNRELAVARASAEEANRSKTRFLRAASHDLLQPLSAAKLFLSALKDTPLDPLQRELTDRLSGAFESVEELMHAVLDISRLDSQRIEFQRKPVDLGELFRRLAVEYAPMAEAKGLRLSFAPTTAAVESDPTFLRRIAQNLVSNAIKYTDRGGVLVGVRKRGERAWLEIYDTGIGIAAPDRARIFDEFQRIGREGGGVPGMGLGLSIVRRACAKLGHPIAMDSEPGRGTVFRVSLPLVAPGVEPARPEGAGHGPYLRGRVALVVENDDAMRRALQLVLQDKLGMVARVSGGIAEALAQMGDEPPDVVIADYNLDNGDTGLEAIAALREAAGQAVPAIVVSARRAPELGASQRMGVPVLEKPVRPEDLQAMLQQMLA